MTVATPPAGHAAPAKFTHKLSATPRSTTGWRKSDNIVLVFSVDVAPGVCVLVVKMLSIMFTNPSAVPVVGATLYNALVAVGAAFVLSSGTGVSDDDVPPVFAVDRFTYDIVTLVAAVALPCSVIEMIRTTRVALPVTHSMSVGVAYAA